MLSKKFHTILLGVSYFAAANAGGVGYPACILACELACTGSLIIPVLLPLYLACAADCPGICLPGIAFCYSNQTQIDTYHNGVIPIEHVRPGDQVMTNNGWSEVLTNNRTDGKFEFVDIVTDAGQIMVLLLLVTMNGMYFQPKVSN